MLLVRGKKLKSILMKNKKDIKESHETSISFLDFNSPEEFRYLEQLILYRLNVYFPDGNDIPKPLPIYKKWSPKLFEFIVNHKLNINEASLLVLGMMPHIQPDLFDNLINFKLNQSGDFQKIGGVRGKDFRGFLPTAETAIFLLADDDFNKRIEIQKLFWADHIFEKKKILWLDDHASGEPEMSSKIVFSKEFLDQFIYGESTQPKFSIHFPAKLIKTELEWKDLVINDELITQVNELKSWLKYNSLLVNEWNMSGRINNGYKALLYGPSGTGKTLTVGLLGKEVGKEVYKIDLSMVLSKYIGETEKNLEQIFAKAEDKGWILFFDEADSLFGKRTNVRDAHDKYANQEVSYLLQRIEDYNGMVILATNMKNNIDDAFMRRFNAILKFSIPEPDERVKIWRLAFPQDVQFYSNDQPTDIPEMVKNYVISGGSIINVVHYACIKAFERQQNTDTAKRIYYTDVLAGIKKELLKEGKPFG